MKGETETGVTLHAMTPKPDDGHILAQARLPIDWDETALSLTAKAADAGRDLVRSAIPGLVDGTVQRLDQKTLGPSTYFGGRKPADSRLDLRHDRRRRPSTRSAPWRIPGPTPSWKPRWGRSRWPGPCPRELPCPVGSFRTTREGLLLGFADGALRIHTLKATGPRVERPSEQATALRLWVCPSAEPGYRLPRACRHSRGVSMRSVITGSGLGLPPHIVTNEPLSSSWTPRMSGSACAAASRSGATPSRARAPTDLGVIAARAAIAKAGLGMADIDAAIFATMTPDHVLPGNGPLLQAALGLRTDLPTFDLRQQCSGFLYGLELADLLIQSGRYRRVLLVGAEVHTAFMPWHLGWDTLIGQSTRAITEAERAENTLSRDRTVLFGDGAGAMVIEARGKAQRVC